MITSLKCCLPSYCIDKYSIRLYDVTHIHCDYMSGLSIAILIAIFKAVSVTFYRINMESVSMGSCLSPHPLIHILSGTYVASYRMSRRPSFSGGRGYS